jgi:lysophospholipase L1-like esterase
MYRHRVAVEAGPWYRVDSASGSNTPVSVLQPDGVTTVGNAFGASGSTVRGNGERGTVEFTSATATLYLKRLTYKGAVAGDTPITSTGQDLTQPAQPDLADVIARLPSTYAALGLAGKQTYDSQDAIALRRFRYALGGRNAAPVDILHVGDSITQGYRASSLANRWPSVMRDHLRTRYPTTGITGGGFGYVPARTISNYIAPFSDNIVTALSGGTNVFGLDGVDIQLGAGNSATFVFTGTGADILTTTFAGGGTYTYTIDGGAASSAVSVAKTGANEYGTITTQIRGLSSASHTLVITRASGTVFLEGIMVYDGDEAKGIRSTVAALAGSYSGDWSTRATTYWPKYISQIQPDLVTIELMANDYINTSPVAVATAKANVKSVIATIKANCTAVPSFVLLPVWAIVGNGTPLAPWASYVTAHYEIAAEDTDGAVCVLDLQKRINTGAAGTVGGMLPDSSHPDDATNRYLGELVANFVAPR